MKTEPQVELHQNALSDSLGKMAVKAQPYTRAIVGVAVALGVVIGIYAFLSSRSKARDALAWDAYNNAINKESLDENVDALREVAEKNQGRPVGNWSQLIMADLLSQEGIDKLFSEREQGREALQKAIESYRTVLEHTRDNVLREWATFGVARAQESLGDLKDAIATYESISKNWPQGPYAKRAVERVEHLNKQSTKDWYTWFATTTPRKSSPPPPRSMLDMPSDQGPGPLSKPTADSIHFPEGLKPEDLLKLPDGTTPGNASGIKPLELPSVDPTAKPDAASPDAKPDAATPSEPLLPGADKPATQNPGSAAPAAPSPDAAKPAATTGDNPATPATPAPAKPDSEPSPESKPADPKSGQSATSDEKPADPASPEAK